MGAIVPMPSTCESSPIEKTAVPSAALAAMRGSTMPSSEPKAIRMMTAAAPMPIASLFEGGVCVACSMAWPPTATSRPGAWAALTRSMTWRTSPFGIAGASFVKATVAYAVLPSRLTWAAPVGV